MYLPWYRASKSPRNTLLLHVTTVTCSVFIPAPAAPITRQRMGVGITSEARR